MVKYGKHLENMWIFFRKSGLEQEKIWQIGVCVYDQRLVKWGFNMQLLWCTVLKNCNYRL